MIYTLWHVDGFINNLTKRVCLPGSLQSLRLRLKDLVRDIPIGWRTLGPSREDKPEGCEVEEVGPQAFGWN